jgi:hypothetical protein
MLLFYTVNLLCQDFSQEYGKIHLSELTFKKYMKDTSADAVIIYDLGKTHFYSGDNGFNVVFDRKTKVRILKPSGVKWAEIEIPYYYEGSIFEKVSFIEAFAYNIEGGLIKKTPLDIKNIYEEKINDFWRAKKFAIPNVKSGTVIEYSYTIDSPYLFNIRDWDFQSKIPTVYSEYETDMIPFYEYIYIMQGKDKFDFYDSKESSGIKQQYGSINYNTMDYRFGMKDVPAFTDESFITSEKDNLIRMDFQLAKVHNINGSTVQVISTWPELCNELLKSSSFGKYCSSIEKSAKDILNLSEFASKTKMEQLEAIVDFVKSKYSWNENNSIYANKTVKEMQKDKTANDANLNLYLTGLLRGAGIEAYPVLISTRDHGQVYMDYPFINFFNYVVVLVKIDGKNILTDATQALCPYDRIPASCINGIGLIVKKDAQEWAKLVNQDISRIDKNISIKLVPEEDSLKFSVRGSYSIYEALNYKGKYKDDAKEIAKSLNDKGYHSIDSLTTVNYGNPKEKYFVNFIAKAPIDVAGNKIYVSPFLNESLTENPLKQSIRTYKVDFNYPFGRTFSSEIIIPEGYKVDYLPQPYTLNNAMVSIDYKVLNSESKISILAYYAFKNAVYEPTDYKNLKFMYNEIIKLLNEKVVFAKK